MIVLAYDLGESMGVAVGETSGTPICFTERLGSTLTIGKRCQQLMLTTRRLILKYEPDLLAIESPFFDEKKPNAGVVLHQYLGAARGMAAVMGVRDEEYSVPAIRKHFIAVGSLGRAEAKDRVLDTCRMLGWPAKTDDQADAAALWEYARAREKVSNLLPNGGLF